MKERFSKVLNKNLIFQDLTPDYNLENFLIYYLKRAGAITEPAGYGLWEVLLPDELMPQLHDLNDSLLFLAFDHEVARENPQSLYITYGSPVLDAFVNLARLYGHYTHLYWPGDPPSPQKDVERKVNESIEFMQCRKPRLVVQWPAEQIFFAFVFRCTFRSFEKTDDTFTVVVDGYTGGVRPDFQENWEKTLPVEFPAYKLPSINIRSPAELYETAYPEAGNMACQQAASIRRASWPIMTRELIRIAGYYEETIREIEKRLDSVEEEKRERFKKQLEATRADWQRREKDVIQRYQIEAEVRLDHLIACHLPCLYAKIEAQHKDIFLHQIVVYNPLYTRWDAPVCPKCRKTTRRLIPDKQGIFICPDHSISR